MHDLPAVTAARTCTRAARSVPWALAADPGPFVPPMQRRIRAKRPHTGTRPLEVVQFVELEVRHAAIAHAEDFQVLALEFTGLPSAPMTWAERLRRVFEIDITTCPDCGGRLRWIADITEPALIRKILLHVQSRAPPCGGLPDPILPGTDAQFTLSG